MKQIITWGLLLWLVGYVLGIVAYMVVPPNYIGYVITPFGVAFTLWVLYKNMTAKTLIEYFKCSLVWTLIAIVLDYLFIVKALNSTSYYKLDVYLYYLTTFTLPLIVARLKTR